MSETSTSTGKPGDEPPQQQPEDRTAPRRLPLGPFGMLMATAFALLIAGAVTWGVISVLNHRNGSESTDISEALDDLTYTPPGKAGETIRIGDKVPRMELVMLGGSPTPISDFVGTGKPALINFWSSTCVPCLKEMPALEATHRKMSPQVTFLGINTQDTESAAAKMVERTKVSYPNARDPRGETATRFGALALPRTVLVDATGKVVATHTGELTQEKILQLLSENGIKVP